MANYQTFSNLAVKHPPSFTCKPLKVSNIALLRWGCNISMKNKKKLQILHLSLELYIC